MRAGARARAAEALATWFGCGYAPVAPGTAGALGALPLHAALRRAGPVGYAAAAAVVTGAGVWAAGELARARGDDDPQCVVVDEVAGTLLALAFVRGRGLGAGALAFALFRVLDATKPWPISALEHARPAGLGIMLDDVLAGLLAGAIARAATRP